MFFTYVGIPRDNLWTQVKVSDNEDDWYCQPLRKDLTRLISSSVVGQTNIVYTYGGTTVYYYYTELYET